MKNISNEIYNIKHPESGYNTKISIKKFRLPDGVIDTSFISLDNNSVQIFALTEDREVVLVKQFRSNVEKEVIELPGGGIEKGEDPKSAAIRELLEETTFQPGNIEQIGESVYGPYSEGKKFMFLATDCVRASKKLDLDDNENLKPFTMSVDEFKDFIRADGFALRGVDLSFFCLDKLNLL